MTVATTRAADVVRRVFGTLNERDWAAFLDLHREDVAVHIGDETIRGVETVAEREWSHFDAFPDLRLEPDDIVAEDSTVAVRWTTTGTHEADFRGIAPTGRRVEYPLMGMFRIEDAHIAEVWLVADRLALMQQIGAVQARTG